MSTLSHSLQQIRVNRLKLAEADQPQVAPEDDGLGCVRGLAVAMLCNVIFLLMIAAGWELWRVLR
jgi:hypothetical protein